MENVNEFKKAVEEKQSEKKALYLISRVKKEDKQDMKDFLFDSVNLITDFKVNVESYAKKYNLPESIMKRADKEGE